MKRTVYSFLALIFTFIIVSTANCEDTFSEKPPSEEQLTPMVQAVLDSKPVRFCFEGYSEPNLTQNAKAIFQSFGKSSQISIRSLKILEVGKYKGYWPIKVHVIGTCVLQYRSDFAQYSPAFSRWRGQTLTRDIDTQFGVDVREDDFGKPQIRLKE